MSTLDKKLYFWYEFASSYSYLSALRIEKLAAAQGVSLAWRPFLLGPIFREQGWDNSPFNIYPAKGKYMWRDVERRAKAYGIPFRKPEIFPQNSVLASRLAYVGQEQNWCPEFTRRVFLANFAEGQDISQTEVLISILQSMGLSVNELMEEAQSPEVKTALKNQTEKAKNWGIFGAPSFIADGELFWGDDRLEEALQHLLASSNP